MRKIRILLTGVFRQVFLILAKPFRHQLPLIRIEFYPEEKKRVIQYLEDAASAFSKNEQAPLPDFPDLTYGDIGESLNLAVQKIIGGASSSLVTLHVLFERANHQA